MARKKIEKAHWMPDAEPGLLRPLTGWGDEDDKHMRKEHVEQTLTDAQLRQTQHDIAAVRESLKEKRDKIAALKAEMKPQEQAEKELLDALVTGTLKTFRPVYAYADDEHGTVLQYDPDTKELLGTRELEPWEMQEEMDLDSDEEEVGSDD